MKKSTAIAAAMMFLIILGLIACSSSQDENVSFRILYTYQTETSYERVEVINDVLYYTYFDDIHGKCKEWIEQRPCWEESDLNKRETTLSSDEIDSLKQTIEDIQFFQMESTYGGASAEQRFYPETLYVKYGGDRKEVIYQNFPEAAPKPEGFERLFTELYMIIIDRL